MSFFSLKTSVDQRFGEMQKKLFFAEFCCKILAFLRFFAAKMLKMTILTSVWHAQHPNAGQNIQHKTPQDYPGLRTDHNSQIMLKGYTFNKSNLRRTGSPAWRCRLFSLWTSKNLYSKTAKKHNNCQNFLKLFSVRKNKTNFCEYFVSITS